MVKNLFAFVLIMVLTFMVPYSPQAFAEDDTSSVGSEESYDSSMVTISNAKYLGGVITAAIPGFGVGHAIQGRYMEKGWIFTALDLLTVGGYFTSAFLTVGDAAEGKSIKKARGMTIAFALAMTGVRIWEVVDAFMLPSNYKVVKESPLQVTPLVSWNDTVSNNLDWGLSLKYKF